MSYDPRSEPSGKAPSFAETKKCLASVHEVNVLAARRDQCLKKMGRGEGSPVQPPYGWRGTYLFNSGLKNPPSRQSACVASYIANGGRREVEHDPVGRDTAVRGKAVKLIAQGQLFREPKRQGKGQSLKQGTPVAVKAGKENKRKDKTYEWCEVQVPSMGANGWLACAALPAELRK